MIDNHLFARRLKAARLMKAQRLGAATARGFPQEQLGIAAGIDEHSASARMNQYERGKRLPDLGTAARLADALDVPMAYLFCVEDDLAKLLLGAHALTQERRQRLIDMVEEVGKG
jgi:transcriptional regulator with XRE-family HTH domain